MLEEVGTNQRTVRSLSSSQHDTKREAFALVCMYSAYLLAVHEGGFKRAFILLARVEKMYIDSYAQDRYTSEELAGMDRHKSLERYEPWQTPTQSSHHPGGLSLAQRRFMEESARNKKNDREEE